MIELVVLGVGVLVSSMVAYALVQIGKIEDLAGRTPGGEVEGARALATATGAPPVLLPPPARRAA